jgi:hypothetical protein
MSPPRPTSNAGAPRVDRDRSRTADALPDFLREKRPRWPAEAVLCLAAWATDALGQPGVSTRDLRALYGSPGVRALLPRLLSPSDTLRMCERGTLVEPATRMEDGAAPRRGAGRAATRYCLTTRGRAVVDALPGRRLVGVVRGLRRSGQPDRGALPAPRGSADG